MNRVYLVATGRNLVGKCVRSVQSVIEEMLLEAEEEIIIAAYTISGNLKDLFRLLERAAARGVKILLIINHMNSQPREVKEILELLSSEFPHVKIHDFSEKTYNLHMKVVVIDRKKALIGSANLTWKGMVENLELGVVIEGMLAEEVSRLIENLAISMIIQKNSGKSSGTFRY